MGVASLFTDKANVSELFINIAMADESLRDFNLPPMSILAIQQLQVLLPLSVCLYVVACSRRRPMLNGIVSIICSLVGLGILGAVFGILIAYLEVTSSGFDAATFMQRFSSRLVMMATAVATLCTVAGIIMTWALHRKLSYRQL